MRDPKSKLAHLEACLLEESQYFKSTGFDKVELSNEAGLETSLDKINLETKFFGKKLGAPLMIAPMTGGIERGFELNKLWAKAAGKYNLAFGVGSQRVALEDPNLAKNFEIRKYAPGAFIFSNIGAAQIARGLDLEKIKQAVNMIEADALLIHFNSMQEACQGKSGDTNYLGLNKFVSQICEYFNKHNIPILAREVGFGLSQEAAQRLINMGFVGLDCAGSGGTSWAKVEALCAKNIKQKKLAEKFGEWGIPTVDSIRNVRQINKEIPLIATGGIRTGQDIAKALSLGANLAAMAQPMLIKANQGEEKLFEFIEEILLELKIALFASNMGKLI